MRKDWIARELTMELIVGVFIVMVLLGLGYFTIILSRERWFGPKENLEVVFNDVMGLREGDNVVARGMTVGKIKYLLLEDSGVRVVATLDAPLHMHENYKITIVATSILGGRYLAVDEGSPDHAPMASSTAVYRGESPYDLMDDAAELVNSAKSAFVEGGLIENLQASVQSLREITDRINAGKGTVGRLLSDNDTLYEDLSAAVGSLRSVTERLERGEGTLGRLLSDDETIYSDLAEVSASLKRVSAKIESGEGLLGRLIEDDGLYEDAEKLVGEVRAAVDDIRETSPVVTFTSILFGAF